MLTRIFLTLIMAACAITSQAAPRALNLSGYQDSSGLIGTFKGGTVADPYFGLYALSLGQEAGLDVSAPRKAFIEWGLKAQQPDGRFARYCLNNTVWTACAKSDSDDATLARWALVLYQDAPLTEPLPVARRKSVNAAIQALFALRLPSGVYSVFKHGTPGYDGYGLFKDNVEVLSAFEQLSVITQARGEESMSRIFSTKARSLRVAMAREFGSAPNKPRQLAVGAKYDKERFYPHGVAVPFAWLENYYPAPAKADWDIWLKKYKNAWVENTKTDFPWGLIALSAMHTGNATEAACWVKRARPLQAANAHWNVLEETSWQILNAAGVSELSGCPN